MNIEIDQELLASFVDDALEVLHGFERAALALRQPDHEDALEELFRTAHNLKGASMCIGLEAFGDFVHSVEDLIQYIVNGQVEANEAAINAILASHQCMSNWVRSLLANQYFVPAIEGILRDLRALSGASVAEVRVSAKQEEPAEHTVAEHEDLDALFKKHRRVYEEQNQEWLKTKSDQPKEVTFDAGIPAIDDDPLPLPPIERLKRASQQSRLHETLRISAQKLDELIQLMSELSIHSGIINEARKNGNLASKAVDHALQLSHKIVKDIHTRALELRMQPLSSLMQRLERSALDLAETQGKKVRVVLEGGDVQLDKSVIERISDPLVHVIRNSIDHGVELPSRRLGVGKSPEAVINIRAVQDTSGVSITVSDDGQGMDEKIILDAALRKGIVKPGEQLSSDQIRKLIFVQGLSTASKLTEISGRGVGMDIVMRTVQSLRGRIDLDSIVGQGTAITISIPTGLSIIDVLVVKVDEERYAVPMQELTEIIDLSRCPVETTGRGGFMISLRGEVIPVEALSRYMPIGDAGSRGYTFTAATGASSCPALVVRDGAHSIAFAIDKIVSQQQIVVRPFGEQLEGLQGFRGCTILGDGDPGVILSLPEIARSYFSALGQRGGEIQ